MKKEFIVLQPSYMNAFQCIGADCPDTCCSGWKVDIDKSTYKKYKKIKDKDMNSKLNSMISKNKNSNNSESVASFELRNGSCGMLKDGLCEIQLNYGEDYLSKTCLIYPRIFNAVDNQIEVSAKLSCPEAARLALSNQKIMEFDVNEQLFDTRFNFSNAFNTDDSAWRSCFWEIRSFVIDILQNRNYSVSDRMIYLGLFCNKLQMVSESNDQNSILSVVNDYSNMMNAPHVINHITGIPSAMHVQIKLLLEMIRKTNQNNFNEYTQKVIEAFSLDSENEDTIRRKFSEGYQQFYAPFVEEHSYILENYLVNLVFERHFLFNSHFEVLDDYIILTTLYSIIKFYIQGMATYNKGMTVDEAIRIIQICSRNIEHDSLYLKRLTDGIKNMDIDIKAALTVLLKD